MFTFPAYQRVWYIIALSLFSLGKFGFCDETKIIIAKEATNFKPRLHLRIGIFPGQRDIRPVISRRRGQCLSGAEEVPRANFRGGTKALASPKGCNGSYIPLARDTTNLYYA